MLMKILMGQPLPITSLALCAEAANMVGGNVPAQNAVGFFLAGNPMVRANDGSGTEDDDWVQNMMFDERASAAWYARAAEDWSCAATYFNVATMYDRLSRSSQPATTTYGRFFVQSDLSSIDSHRVLWQAHHRRIAIEWYKRAMVRLDKDASQYGQIASQRIKGLLVLETFDRLKISVGCWVEAKAAFISDNDLLSRVPQYSVGQVESIDENGDALIKFENVSHHTWVFKENLHKVSVISEEAIASKDQTPQLTRSQLMECLTSDIVSMVLRTKMGRATDLYASLPNQHRTLDLIFFPHQQIVPKSVRSETHLMESTTAEMFFWLNRSVEQYGHGVPANPVFRARNILVIAGMYMLGVGVKQNTDRSAKYYFMATEQGSTHISDNAHASLLNIQHAGELDIDRLEAFALSRDSTGHSWEEFTDKHARYQALSVLSQDRHTRHLRTQHGFLSGRWRISSAAGVGICLCVLGLFGPFTWAAQTEILFELICYSSTCMPNMLFELIFGVWLICYLTMEVIRIARSFGIWLMFYLVTSMARVLGVGLWVFSCCYDYLGQLLHCISCCCKCLGQFLQFEFQPKTSNSDDTVSPFHVCQCIFR